MQTSIIKSDSDQLIIEVKEVTPEELDNRLNLFFSSQGYKLKSTEGETRLYEKGNRVVRLLLGAFSTYHKQKVIVRNSGQGYHILIQKDSTGMSGGIIGMNQVKKEFKRLTDAFDQFLRH